jgi:formylglycine-generating enzyme required for sulfatase activity
MASIEACLSHCRPACYDPVFQTPNHPRVGVNWFEAMAFCRWLTQQLRQKKVLTESEEIRLPHEAEWEQAARWNSKESQADDRHFPWGNEEKSIAQRCNMSKTGIGHTSAVGLSPSGKADCGAMDLAGNVWEWCENLHNPDEEWRVLRGGSWLDGAPHRLRCSSRNGSHPVNRFNYLGFRCVVVGVSTR